MTPWEKECKSKTPAVLTLVLSIVLSPIVAFVVFVLMLLAIPDQTGIVLLCPLIVFAVALFLVIKSIVDLVKINAYNSDVYKKYENERIAMENNQKAMKEAQERSRNDALKNEARIYLEKIYMPSNNGSLDSFADGTTGALLYEIDGKVTNILQVYEDRCILIAKTTARSYVAGSYLSGTKEFFYDDLINVQFRPATSAINGFLQFEYSGAQNIGKNNYTSENSFVFSPTCCRMDGRRSDISAVEFNNEVIANVYRFIHEKIVQIKSERRAYYKKEK